MEIEETEQGWIVSSRRQKRREIGREMWRKWRKRSYFDSVCHCLFSNKEIIDFVPRTALWLSPLHLLCESPPFLCHWRLLVQPFLGITRLFGSPLMGSFQFHLIIIVGIRINSYCVDTRPPISAIYCLTFVGDNFWCWTDILWSDMHFIIRQTHQRFIWTLSS